MPPVETETSSDAGKREAVVAHKISPNPRIPPIPWSSIREWQEVNQVFSHQLGRNDILFHNLKILANDLQAQLASLIPILDRLGEATCRWCPDPCCTSATPWFDFKDLLYLNLLDIRIPMGQPIDDLKMRCRYLGRRGCFLPRPVRPFICTWYLCPTQTNRLKGENSEENSYLLQTIGHVKRLRVEMEALFIETIMKQ